MLVDKTTLYDLSIFNTDEEQSLFHHFNYTTTTGGKEWLRYLFAHPYSDLEKIIQTQKVLQIIQQHEEQWPVVITNGTVMVIEKYFETAINEIPQHLNSLSAGFYKIVNAADYSITKYSVNHFGDFAIGLAKLVNTFEKETIPPILQVILDRIRLLLNRRVIAAIIERRRQNSFSTVQYLVFGRHLKREFKPEALELVDIYSKLDAYLSMARACKKHKLCYPVIQQSEAPYITTSGLYHPLLSKPVAYDVQLDRQQNFLFLTGANMAGKSTFIKAVGVTAYLAHLGMGVPAESCRLSLLHGLLSNIQVVDNIIRGESYFFNEVQRVKKTVNTINNKENWLILIDELFKGTNVQDAMKCSTTVIEGLRRMNNGIFILSTHLYEIGEHLRQYPNIQFRFFETHISNDQLLFSYQLKDGISNDRLGYLILKREGVVEMLENL